MRIIIVDDDPLVCESLRTIAEVGSLKQGPEPVEVVAVGHDGEAAIRLYREHRPDILLLDIRMEPVDGLAAGERILREFPDARLLYLTTFLDDEYIVRALRIGAKGYLMKSGVSSLLPSLAAIARGQRVFGDEIVEKLPPLLEGQKTDRHAPDPADLFSELTERERAIVELIADGKNNREIAEELHFSEGTVRNYISEILDKLEVRDRTQLAVLYYKRLNR